MNPLVMLWLGALGFLVAAMATAWLLQRLTGQGGWVDAIWSYAVGAAGVGVSLWPIAEAPHARQWLVAILIGLWGLRLGTHVARRAASGDPDPRYARLLVEWGGKAQAMMFGFLMLQALAGAILVASVMLAARREGALGPQDALATLIYLIAVGGEALADAQLAACKRDPAMKGKVCDRGLWAWSRHPNYFFEWLGWCAWPVFAIDIGFGGGSAWGLLTLSGAAYMYWLLRYVSGVPPLEEHMRRSRPEAFAAYSRRTSVFFPWPPRQG